MATLQAAANQMAGCPFWILLYADDMVIVEKSHVQIQALLATVQQALQDWGMQMSIPKTKYVCYGKGQHSGDHPKPLQIAQHEIEHVAKFRYLGSMQTSDQSVRAEVSNRLAGAAKAWLKLSKVHVWDDDCISRGIKCTLYKVGAQSTLLYASETWAFPKQQVHRLENFQMKCLRKICKISFKDKIRNDYVLGWCNVARNAKVVSHRRLRWLGHLARMPNERLPKCYLDIWMAPECEAGVRSNGWKCQGRPTLGWSFTYMVEEVPRQGRLEGCHSDSECRTCCNAPDLRIGKRVMNELMTSRHSKQ